VAEDRPLRVGDFVSIRGRSASSDGRLGRIERIEGDVYQVRMLMPHRRWAVQTTPQNREWLEPASHDFVRKELGLEVGTTAGPAEAAEPERAPLEPSPTMATKALPRRPLLARASPAADRSLSARVLRPAAPPATERLERRSGSRLGPMPAGDLTELFSTVSYRLPFRRYQSLALEAFERGRATGRRCAYIVMPPGSGKTVLGLEIARRLGNRVLCLGPNTAIQGQWLEQWSDFQPAGRVTAGADPSLASHFTALTYQALCDIDPHSPDLEEQVAELQFGDTGDRYVSADLRRKSRLLAAEGGQHEQLLALLHPNGRRLLEKIASGGSWTLVLDECHHLLEMWGYLLRSLIREVGDSVFIVGLTATPPDELDTRQAELHRELFGRADFEVATPAVVKEGNLAPYQELVYVTTPLDNEAEYIESEKLRFEELVTALLDPQLGTVSFLDWFDRRFVERRSRQGGLVGWEDFEADQPHLAQAALRYCFWAGRPPPPGAGLREGDREPPSADDWVYLIDDYCVGHLRGSEAAKDLAAWELIRGALPSLGFALGYHGVRSYISPVDRVLLLSAGKAVAAAEILAAEERALGPRLRALLLCDFEVAGGERPARLEGVLDPQAGSAALLLRTLLADPDLRRLNPVLVTGRTVACSRETAVDLGAWLEEVFELTGLEGAASDDPAGPVVVRPARGSWEPGDYLPRITRYFEEGRSRCLVGTRGLLGEGWDARSVNVLLDLTGVTTTTSVHQMRGRSLRLDPELPRKVADNWDVVCIAPDYPMGLADYSRFVRKHRNYFGLTETGEIESGVSHVDARLSPFGPPAVQQLADLNLRQLRQPEERESVYGRWRIGAPYQNLPTQTLRVRFGRSPGLAKSPLRTTASGVEPPPSIMGRLVGTLLAGTAAYGAGLALGQDLIGLEVGLVLFALGLGWTGASIRRYLQRVGPAGTLESMAAAVAEGLSGAGLVAPGVNAESIRVVVQPDGYYRCYPAGASLEDSSTFAAALEELLSPIQQPRYIIPRHTGRPPTSTLGALGLVVRESVAARGGAVAWHAVPAVLGANREWVEVFNRAWNRLVSDGEALYQQDPRGEAILELQRGEDPFDVLTQMRTLWE
jgi:superfamily II DNA or RNA helicase